MSYVAEYDSSSYESWEYWLEFKNGKLICDGKGRLYKIYDDDSSSYDIDSFLKTVYDNGSAEFIMTPEGIVWNDLENNRGEGMVFTYSGPIG